MEERFKFINDADFNTNVGTSKSADNTIKSTQWIVNLWNDWATARNSHQNNS
jgi:hypothetical protein